MGFLKLVLYIFGFIFIYALISVIRVHKRSILVIFIELLIIFTVYPILLLLLLPVGLMTAILVPVYRLTKFKRIQRATAFVINIAEKIIGIHDWLRIKMSSFSETQIDIEIKRNKSKLLAELKENFHKMNFKAEWNTAEKTLHDVKIINIDKDKKSRILMMNFDYVVEEEIKKLIKTNKEVEDVNYDEIGYQKGIVFIQNINKDYYLDGTNEKHYTLSVELINPELYRNEIPLFFQKYIHRASFRFLYNYINKASILEEMRIDISEGDEIEFSNEETESINQYFLKEMIDYAYIELMEKYSSLYKFEIHNMRYDVEIDEEQIAYFIYDLQLLVTEVEAINIKLN